MLSYFDSNYQDISLETSHFGAPTSAIWSKGDIQNFACIQNFGYGWDGWLQQKKTTLSETGQDRTTVAVDH